MKKILIAMIAGAFLFTGCDPAEIPGKPYDGPNYVYFYVEDSGSKSAIVSYTLSSSSSQPISVTRSVLAVGELADYDRIFKLGLSLSPDTLGDYDLSRLLDLGEDTYTMPAGQTEVEISFQILNDDEYLKELKGKTIVLLVKIVPTDDFALGFQYQTLRYQLVVSPSYQ